MLEVQERAIWEFIRSRKGAIRRWSTPHEGARRPSEGGAGTSQRAVKGVLEVSVRAIREFMRSPKGAVRRWSTPHEGARRPSEGVVGYPAEVLVITR